MEGVWNTGREMVTILLFYSVVLMLIKVNQLHVRLIGYIGIEIM